MSQKAKRIKKTKPWDGAFGLFLCQLIDLLILFATRGIKHDEYANSNLRAHVNNYQPE